MKNVLFAGASGFVGEALVPALAARGHRVTRLVRDPRRAAADDAALWEPARGRLDPALVERADVVINLCGKNIGAGRWTERVKSELRSSRLDTTRLLADRVTSVESPPALLINASATGIYGDRGDEQLDEGSAPGSGFLADLARAWEEEAAAARTPATRVVPLRLGMVVGRGGALARMLPVFRLGLGGRIGNGRQWWPWVGIADVVGVVCALVEGTETDGPINLVSPQALRCAEFTRELGRALRRPTPFPAPRLALKLALGEMAEALLLASARVTPRVLAEELDHRFSAPTLAIALEQALA